MLTTSASLKTEIEGVIRDIAVTPLFLRNNDQPWQPNEIYGIIQTLEVPQNDGVPQKAIEPLELGKIIVDDKMDWRYEGDHDLSEDEVKHSLFTTMKFRVYFNGIVNGGILLYNFTSLSIP